MSIPTFGNRNIIIFYILTVLKNAWFITGNWIFFWSLYMTYGQMGILDTIGFLFGMLMEIPTGGLADIIGRKRTLLVSFLLSGMGIFVMTFGHAYAPMFAGFLIAQLGWALYSGSAEAMAFDSLVEIDEDSHFDRVISFGTALGVVATSATILVGTWLYKLSPSLPHIAWGMASIVALPFVFAIKEPSVRRDATLEFSIRQYLHQMSLGAKRLMSSSLVPYIAFIFTLSGAMYMFTESLTRPAVSLELGFGPTAQGVIFTVAGLVAVATSLSVPYLRKFMSDFVGLSLLSMTMAAVWLLLSVKIGVWGAIPIVLVTAVGSIGVPWISIAINNETPASQRATTLSTVSFVAFIPTALVGVLVGHLAQHGHVRYFTFAVACVIFLLTVVNMLRFNTSSVISRQ